MLCLPFLHLNLSPGCPLLVIESILTSILCEKHVTKAHRNTLVNLRDLVKDVLDIDNSVCGIIIKNNCILLVPITLRNMKDVLHTCSNNGYRNIDTITAEKFIIALMQPIWHFHNFSYIVIQGQLCKRLTALKEPGIHQMIVKWTWYNCEAIKTASSPILVICEVPKSLKTRKPKVSCGYHSFSCFDGTCLASTSVCDGHEDCLMAEDETNCMNITHYGNYECRDGQIITADKRCNLITDCTDGDDEINCFHVSNGCMKRFRCRSGQCIDLEYVCDGFYHCADHTDENHCLDYCNFGFSCSDSSCVLLFINEW